MKKKVPKLTLPVVKPLKPRAQKRTREQKQDVVESRVTNKVMTREQKRRWLYRIVHSARSTPDEKIKAINVDNRMSGDEAPQKHDVRISEGFWDFAKSGDTNR
ncbi:hypothetical protein [Geminisphaera colitermitum]|uniref:hypothetical protein n=1 Tax=Geminisphaera colitermitum TaxID=1148786 RepID=UPI000158D4B2|nr:hypothetical protein [Geminisphaera colitermitum]